MAISHERQYNQSFILEVYELELQFVKQQQQQKKKL